MSPLRVIAATLAATAAVAVAQAGPAAAAPPITPGATAFSVPVFTGSAALRANLTLTGSLGGLLDGLIGPIVNQNLNPLVTALQSLAFNSAVASTLGISSSYVAGTPAFQTTPAPAPFPTDVVPAPCGVAVGLPCYSASSGLDPLLGSLASIGLSLVNGYTQQVQNSADSTSPMFGRAQIGNPSVRVLPAIAGLANPLVSAGTVNAKANCPNNGSDPSATASATSVNLLGGLVTFGVLDGDITSLKVNGVSYTSIDTLPTLTVAGITIAPFGGTAVKVTVPISAAQILGALGLAPAVVTTLLGDAVGSSLNLGIIVGPRTSVTSTSATATGLTIGADLSGSLNFSLLGLVGATVSIPSGIRSANYGNVLDLRMGYTTCTTGAYAAAISRPVPPVLV
jgi:hypothetical protein